MSWGGRGALADDRTRLARPFLKATQQCARSLSLQLRAEKRGSDLRVNKTSDKIKHQRKCFPAPGTALSPPSIALA